MTEVRQVQIRGGAVADYTKERKTRKRKQDGGFDVPSSGEIPFTGANMTRVTNLITRMSGGAAPPSGPPPGPPSGPPPGPPSPASPPPVPVTVPQTGGKVIPPKPKLILEKKKSMKKLHLAPASVSGKRSAPKTRKIRMNLSGMKKRLTRAKEIQGDSRKKDISEIKKILQEAKLLKPRTSEKPDSSEYDLLLRNTYENYMLLRNRAL